MTETGTGSSGRLARLWRSDTATLLRQPDFRRLYVATTISTAGDALYFVAMTWLTFDLTGSTLVTGLAVAISRLPAVASVLIGPLVDRAPLGRLLPAVELVQVAAVAVVPVAHLLGVLSVGLVLVVVAIVATLQRVSDPAAQATLPRIVADRLLPRANAISASSRQTVRALAEAASGLLIAVIGAVWLFLVDAVTFAISAALLLALRVPPADDTPTRTGGNDDADTDETATAETDADEAADGTADSGAATGLPSLGAYVADIREGLATIRESVLLDALAGATLASLGTGLSTAVLPAFGAALSGAQAYGLLIAAATAGTLLGSTIAARFEDRPFGSVVVGGFTLAALARVATAVVEIPGLVYVAFGLSAVPVGVYNVLVSTVIQIGVPDGLLARVSSTNGTVLAVVGPIGLVAGGALGEVLPAAAVVGLSAVGYLLIAGYWVAVPELRSFRPVVDVESGAFAPE